MAAVSLPNANSAIQYMIASLRGRNASKESEYVLAGIAGPPKSGKSGGVLDSRTKEEIKNGARVHLDFDMGGLSTVVAPVVVHLGILVFNPWEFNYDAETNDSYDFLLHTQRQSIY